MISYEKIQTNCIYKIIKLMSDKNMSFSDIGAILGVSRQAAFNIIDKKTDLSLKHIVLICNHFKIDIQNFMFKKI